MKKLYQLLLDRWNQKTDTVLVTIVEGNGSVPRTTGAYMVVAKNGRIYGTIGGGNLEYQAVKKAMELAGTAAHYVENFDLGTGENSELGMVCGGRVKVLFYSACEEDTAGFWRKTDRRFTQKNSVTMEGFTFLEAVIWLRSWFRCSVIWDSGVWFWMIGKNIQITLCFREFRRQRP